MKTAIVIPARFESSRYQGKPLAMINGKSLIHRVWERCCLAVPAEDIYVATDHDGIAAHCREHGIRALMTPSDCATGTDRVWRASQQVKADLILNVQGDEPLIEPGDIQAVVDSYLTKPTMVHNGMCPIETEEDFRSPSVPKVVARDDGRLMYMSRAAIPTDKKLAFREAMKQVCIYAFPPAALEAYGRRGRKSRIESFEDIEILRFFELGWEIQMVRVSGSAIAVDFPEDVARVEKALRDRGIP